MKGLNTSLYWENQNLKGEVSIVPTSALTGEGVPDLLYMIMRLSHVAVPKRLYVKKEFRCSVLEVKNIEGLGIILVVLNCPLMLSFDLK